MNPYTLYYSGENDESVIVPKEAENLIISETVQRLPENFCRACFHLQTVVFSGSSSSSGSIIQRIPSEAFYGCNALREIVLPSTVTAIGDRAFNFCTSLTKLAFPAGLKIIGKSSFVACDLRQLRIPGSVEVIEESAFSGCPSLRQVELLEGSTKVIGPYAFASCLELVDLSLPSTLEVIGDTAFGYCQALKTVDLPKGLKKIGRRVFDQARGLQSIAIPSGVEHLEEHAFYGCSRLRKVRLEYGLRSIGVSTFGECKLLTSILIPKTVETIGDVAFECCGLLVEVILVNGCLTSIGEDAFVCCSNLQSIFIPSSVRHVGERAFDRCDSLVTVEIPEDSETSFGQGTFSRCPLLANIAIPRSVDQEQITVLQDCRMIEETYGGTNNNAFECIRSRFQEYPIHGVCYYAPDGGGLFCFMFALKMQREDPNPRDYTHQLVDPFGMTPFHIVMSAARKVPGLLHLLLNNYPHHVLGHKNRNGSYALEYLVSNWTSNSEARSMAEMTLQKWMVEGMQNWGLKEWRSVMAEKVNLALRSTNDLKMDDRRNSLHEACHLMVQYEHMEATSLLELWLWKMKMQSMRRPRGGTTKVVVVDRESNRARCGAEFIVPYIIDFLWGSG